jgi:Mg-chelatase subunit ChlD
VGAIGSNFSNTMFAVALLVVLALAGPANAAQIRNETTISNGCAAPVDIALALDGSASISAAQWAELKLWASKLAGKVLVSAGSASSSRDSKPRLGVVQFATDARVEFGLTENATAAQEKISGLVQLGTKTAIGAALRASQGLFGSGKRLVPGGKYATVDDRDRVILVMTDGVNNAGPSPKAEADAAKKAGRASHISFEDES